ncbi:MAG: GTPase ObgE [Candidatus Saccharimonadales bacterium]
MFVDNAVVSVSAGRGGDGHVSFRTEKYVDRGGPDGGDGGRGGDVILEADDNQSTLVDFRIKREIKAENGEKGSMRRRHGKNGGDRLIKVPVGTSVLKGDELLVDLVQSGQRFTIARGGSGGFGNAHFTSSTRQAPRVAELGEKGDAFEAKLELKLVADVGLVGFPNAGKSTFLSVVSNARPEIADYAFTTLTPNLGVADIDNTSLLIADIPGLIEGASEGKGLGDAFLKHIERTAVILHLIDAYDDDPGKAYKVIRHELENHSALLAGLPEIIVLSKTDGLDTEIIDSQMDSIRQVAGKKAVILSMSSAAHIGITEVLRALSKKVSAVRAEQKAALEAEEGEEDDGTTISLTDRQLEESWRVRLEEGSYVVTGTKIERFASRTDYGNVHTVNRLRDIMRKMGITHDLVRKGAQPDDVIIFGEIGEYKMRLEEKY